MSFSWISNALDLLTTAYGSQFLTEGHVWLKYIAIIILTVYALKWGLVSVSGHGGYDLPGLVQFFVMFSLDSAMLIYYNNPLPWCSSSVATIFPDTAQQLSAILNNTALANTVQKFKDAIDNIEDPQSLVINGSSWIVWAEATGFMYICEGMMFVVNIVGFLMVGVGVLLGPLFIPFFIVPRLSWLFWNWIQFMLEFSFWRLVSTAVVFVWATAWGSFFDLALRGDYSLAHFAELMPAMLAMTVGMIWNLFFVSKVTSDLFKGSATAGANYVGGLAIAARAVFA